MSAEKRSIEIRRYLFLVLSFILLFFFARIKPTEARRLVKIATIGAVSPAVDKSQGYQQIATGMVAFLRREINQVLPDCPDLIVLPEACDRPSGLKIEEQFKYFKTRGDRVQDFLASVARANHCYIAFGMKRQDNDGLWRNSCIILDYKLAHLDNNWKKLDALKIKYGKDVVIYDPGEIGVVMITSESDSISAEDMVKEFRIELVEDYFNRTRAMRLKSGNMK